MKYIELKTVETENNKQEKFVKINVIISVLILTIGFLISNYVLFINPMYASVGSLISFIGIFVIKWKYKRYKINGKVTLAISKIILDIDNSKTELTINNNTKLLLYYRGTKGEMFDMSFGGIGYFGYKDGADNFLKYTNIETGETSLFNILLEKEEQLKGIKIIFSEIKKMGIPCKVIREDYKLKKRIIDNKSAFDWKLKQLEGEK